MQGLSKQCFDDVLIKAQKRLKAVHWEMEQTAKASQADKMDIAYNRAFLLAAEVERLALMTRVLPSHTGNAKAPFDLNNMLLEECGVEVGYTSEGWFSVQIPALLPRKESGNADYIRTMLYPALQQFFQTHAPIRLYSCVLVFRHVYEEGRPEREYRDHDNIELNMVVDMLAVYTMQDDSPMRCRHYYCSAAGNSNRTEVYVVPRRDFPEWLKMEHSYGMEPLILNYG